MIAKPWETDLSIYDDESALLAGLQRRDRLACTCLLKRYAPGLYRLALQVTGDPDEAEDVLQEGFIRACAHVADFEGRSALGTWLHRIVLNAALARVRQRSRADTGADLFAVAETLADPAPEPGRAILTTEFQQTIERALLALPDALRVVFVLRDIEGLSTREAAVALDITESALKVRLHRAHRALRTALAPYLQPQDGASGGGQP